MKNHDYKYVDVAFNGVNNRNKVIDVTKLKVPQNAKDCYRTVFRFKEDFKEHVEKKGSVSGYRGSAYADFFPIDIDENNDLERAHETAKTVIEKLEVNYDVDINGLKTYFSGAKGFHILIPEKMIGIYATPDLPLTFKEMAREMLNGVNFDASIYDHTRLFRLTNTINSSTGLYKIPLTTTEILHKTTSEIYQLAKQPRKVEFLPNDEMDENDNLKELFMQTIRRVKENQGNDILKPSNKQIYPKDAKICYYKILEGVGQGERDNAALRLSTHFKKQGYTADITLGMLQAWNKRNQPPLDYRKMEKFVYQAYEHNYDYGCKDHLLQQYCDSKCHLVKKKNERVTEELIYNIYDLRKKYEEYIEDLDKRKIQLGVKVLDERLRGVAPGEVLQIIARSGVGKTAIVLNIMKNVGAKQDTPILFFSLEMPGAQIYERMVQISGKYEGEEVETTFKTKSQDKETMNKVVEESYGNAYVVDQDFLTLDELKEYVQIAEAKIGQSIGLICVDYLGRMQGRPGPEYEVISELAKQLKNLAKETDKAVICLHQTNRTGGTGAEPVQMDMGRGSGQFEEAADHIIGAWRPDIEEPTAIQSDTENIVLGVLKGRKGPKCQHEMCLNKRKLIITEWDKVHETENYVEEKEAQPF